jgi:Peptidase A4 family
MSVGIACPIARRLRDSQQKPQIEARACWKNGEVRRVSAIALIAGVAAAAVAASASSPAAAASRLTLRHAFEVTSNWAGYAITPRKLTSRFSSVSARWKQPTADCSSGEEAYSSFWVGLGGYSETSEGLEQIGTEADCSPDGAASYSMWYEVLPAASTPIKLKVFPGNVVAASVKIVGKKATFQIQNVTRKTTFKKTVNVGTLDVSSAEWVAEAPTGCDAFGACTQLPLTNFGTVSFTKASATAAGHTGTISDTAWTSSAMALVEDGSDTSDDDPLADDTTPTSGSGAVPGTLSSNGSAFAISWQEAVGLRPLP